MEVRRLGESCLLITPVGIGTAPIGSTSEWHVDWGPQDEDEAITAIRTAVQAGVNWIDTAPFYGWGRAEMIVGKALQGIRDRVLIFTKCGTIRDKKGGFHEDLKPKTIMQEVKESLRRLKTDHIDLLQFHDPDPDTPIEESWRAAQKLVDEGLIGHTGLSNHPLALVDRAKKIGPVTSLQVEYNPLARNPEAEIMPYCLANRIGMLGWGSLAEGFLADGFSLESLSPTDFRRRHAYSQPTKYTTINEIRNVIKEIADKHGKRMVDVVVAWEISHPGLAGAIIGIRNGKEAVEMIGGADLDLSRDDIASLENAFGLWNQVPK